MKLWIISGLFFIFLISIGYAECEDPILEYKKCVDAKCGTGYVKQEGCAAPCAEILNNNAQCKEEVCLKHSCQVTVTSDFDGVSADGVSKIKFTMAISRDYEDFALELMPREREILRGKIEDISDREIVFTPDKADENKNYLTPQVAQAVGWCVPKQAACETEEPQKQYSRKDFTIVQPPLFFVHGIKSSAEVWGTFKQRAGMDKWWYGDISYSSEVSNKYNAKQLSEELQKFIQKVNSGGSYYGKKISATKVDIVSHSMGGLVTRYYIGSKMYKGNIRKFLMLATPNHGAWDNHWLSKTIWTDEAGNPLITSKQLRPDDSFIVDLNKQPSNPNIEYHTIAGTGWHTNTGFDKLTTWRGDGVVLVDSVKLPGVPLYCTHDTHAAGVRWVRLLLSADPLVALRGFDTRDDITITASEVAYGIAKNALLYGGAISAVDCSEEGYKSWYNTMLEEMAESVGYDSTSNKAKDSGEISKFIQIIAWLHSPATLHAYDEKGNHIGPDRYGRLENTIGEGAYYLADSSDIEGQVIRIFGDKKIRFVMVGNATGKIGFTFIGLSANGSIMEKDYENMSIDRKTQYVFNASSETPELTKQEVKAGVNWYAPAIAILVIVCGVLLVKKLKKK